MPQDGPGKVCMRPEKHMWVETDPQVGMRFFTLCLIDSSGYCKTWSGNPQSCPQISEISSNLLQQAADLAAPDRQGTIGAGVTKGCF